MAGAHLCEQGAALLRTGHHREAADTLADAVAQDPGNTRAWRLLGGALSALEERDGAIAAFERAVSLDPNSPKNHYNLGLALLKGGRAQEAQAHFAHALQLDPNYAPAQAYRHTTPPPPLSYQPSPGGYVPPPGLGYGPQKQERRSPPGELRTLILAGCLFLVAVLLLWWRFSR